VIEASADEALLNTYRNQLKEDEFVVMMGRLQLATSAAACASKCSRCGIWRARVAGLANICM